MFYQHRDRAATLVWPRMRQSADQRIMRHPYSGIGKPESLKHVFQGYWSRRIISEHRIVYKRSGNQSLIAQLRYYY